MDPTLGGRFQTIDPLAEKYYSISPYAYCANNPVKYVDPDGRDWYLNERTGELYYNKNITNETTTYLRQTYVRIGDNKMMDNMGKMKEQYFSYDNAQDFISDKNYNILPSQQLVSSETTTSTFKIGKQNVSIEDGEHTVINEKYAIVSADQEMKTDRTQNLKSDSVPTFFEALMGSRHQREINVNFSKPTDKRDGSFEKIMSVGSAIMTGRHNYTTIVTYTSWNAYEKATNGNGRLLQHRLYP